MLWQINFFPKKGERNSPYNYISSLNDKNEQASIAHRLQAIADLPVEQWPSAWIHKIEGKIFQLAAGKRSRLMYCFDDNSIIILHC